MRILYGVVGEGMGHATRSRVVIEHLLASGHQVQVVVSGRAFGFLTKKFEGRAGITIHEIHGLHLDYDGNRVDLSDSVLQNIAKAPGGVVKNAAAWLDVEADRFDPQVVISDFESWSFYYAKNRFLPVISIDNMQILNRGLLGPELTNEKSASFRLAKAAVKVKLPGCYHYLVSSFFFPPVRKKRTTLVPPILRPEILAATRAPGEHVLVYQTAASNEALLPTLASLPYRFTVYGLGREEERGNVSLRAFSEAGFVEDLRTARAVIAGGGFSLLSECVHLRVPVLSVPIGGQFEQELNARALQDLGYGTYATALDADVLESFLREVPRHEEALKGYTPRDNQMLFNCVTELLSLAARGVPRPDRLVSPALGSWEG